MQPASPKASHKHGGKGRGAAGDDAADTHVAFIHPQDDADLLEKGFYEGLFFVGQSILIFTDEDAFADGNRRIRSGGYDVGLWHELRKAVAIGVCCKGNHQLAGKQILQRLRHVLYHVGLYTDEDYVAAGGNFLCTPARMDSICFCFLTELIVVGGTGVNL